MSLSTLASVLGLALGFAPAPATDGADAAPQANVWVRSGARSWTRCQSYEVEAARRLVAGIPPGEERALLREWRARVEACPQVPAALVLTALLELANPPKIDPSIDFVDTLPELGLAFREQRQRILHWIAAAEREAARRGEPVPEPARYIAAYASVGLDDPAAAARVQAAREAAEFDAWRIDRLDAMVRLREGDLAEALRLAHRSLSQATNSGRPASTYVLAMVLDRSGSIAAARSLLSKLRIRDARTLGGLESLLPLRERIYLMALDQEARGHRAGAYTLWQAYLEVDGVEAPEREQVRRRLDELRPGPTFAGD
ncbi:MAG: hypothetical protein R3A79_27445 [Nannocystaceae bacterium]